MTQYVCIDDPWQVIEAQLNSIPFEVKTVESNRATLKTLTPAIVWYTNKLYELKFHVFQKPNEDDIHCLYTDCPPELAENVRKVNEFYWKHMTNGEECVLFHGVHRFSHWYGSSMRFFLKRIDDAYIFDVSPKSSAELKEMLHTKTLRCQFAFSMTDGVLKGSILQVKGNLLGLRLAETDAEPLSSVVYWAYVWGEHNRPTN